jgi:hypothetical protein
MSHDRFHRTRIEKSAINFGDGGSATVSLGPDAPAAGDPDPPLTGVFISYRREDTPHAAGRLGETLARENPDLDVFVDVRSIRPATDFLRAVSRHLSSSFLALALIGPNWLQPRDGRSRLADPEDTVRRELELALSGGVTILPVLVDGARLPDARDVPGVVAAVLRQNAARLRHEEFADDAARISQIVRREYGRRR